VNSINIRSLSELPAYLLPVSQPVDYNASWPSSYADNGRVSWQRTTVRSGDHIEIAYPEVRQVRFTYQILQCFYNYDSSFRWANLRATEGWAALQHHVILKTTLMLVPPTITEASSDPHIDPRILVNLTQGSYFTLKPKNCPPNFVPRWVAGNIYDLERALPACVDLSGSISTPGHLEYELFVSGDYEVTISLMRWDTL
jgi:hypothetical protein